MRERAVLTLALAGSESWLSLRMGKRGVGKGARIGKGVCGGKKWGGQARPGVAAESPKGKGTCAHGVAGPGRPKLRPGLQCLHSRMCYAA